MSIDSKIRKYFFDQLNSIYPVFDSLQGSQQVNKCYLVSAQSRDKRQDTKCGYAFDCTIEIECMNRKDVTSNTQSRLIVEEMETHVENAFDNLNFSNFVITEKEYNTESFAADVAADNKSRIVVLINFKLQ